jgi:hypothetical protein
VTRLEKRELISVLVAVRAQNLKFAESKLRELIIAAAAEHEAEDAVKDTLENAQRGKPQ